MFLRLLLVCAGILLVSLVLWLLHGALLLPIRKGSAETIDVIISAEGDAPELEMQLRGLLWLRNHGIVPCSIAVRDIGLTPETLAVLQKLSEKWGIRVSRERGTDENG